MLLIGIACGAQSIAATRNACPTEMYQRADASLGSASSNWRSLELHQRSFAPCDDGALAEGYSDAVVTLLANHWDQIGTLVALSEGRPAFRRWVIRHIDASASSDDLQRLVRNAASCDGRPNAKALCGEVARAAANAISD